MDFYHQLLCFPLFFLLSSVLPSIGSATVTARCLPTEGSILLQLKREFYSSKQDYSSNLTSWQYRTDCCRWEGVVCDPVLARVISLNLSYRDISGKIVSTSALFNLTSLHYLDLSGNNFYPTTLPAFGFERLSNLTHLNLFNAGFVGQVPIGIAHLTNLILLDLSVSDFTPDTSDRLIFHDPSLRTLIKNLSNLRELYLDGSFISSEGSDWCRALSESVPLLQVLSLADCFLSGPIDPSLLRLSSLTNLNLQYNNFSSTMPEFFANFSSLSSLQLAACGLEGLFPQKVFQLKNLTLLDVSDNPMLFGNLPDFYLDSSLEQLVLSGTSFSGAIPNSIGYLKSLTELDLSDCSFWGPVPSSIFTLTQLFYLDLSSNNFNSTSVIPNSIGSLKSLMTLDLSGCSFWGPVPSSIFTLTQLLYLNLSSNNFNGTGAIPNSIGSLKFLTTLDLSGCSFWGPIPSSIFTLTQLFYLDLSSNNFNGTGAIPNSIGSLTSLTTLDLSGCSFWGPIPSSIFILTQLRYLDLSSNNFNGTMELGSFWSLRNLWKLSLSNNKLTVIDGEYNYSSMPSPQISRLYLASCNLTKFPTALFHLPYLTDLDLSCNNIHGVMPLWIWEIRQNNLNTLNLSHNMLTNIERSLSILPLSYIEILNLSHNMIDGPVPLPQGTYRKVLDYSNNRFSSIPPNISSHLQFVVFLQLSRNHLIGNIPTSICEAGALEILDLSYNRFSGLIPSCLMEGNNRLGVLNLRGNTLLHGTTLPSNISRKCSLQTLILNDNGIEGPLPRSLANCGMLEVLDLGNNRIVDSFPFWLGNLSMLQVLILSSNQFYGSVELPLQGERSDYHFPSLTILDLSSNIFTGKLSQSLFENLTAMMVTSFADMGVLEFNNSIHASISYNTIQSDRPIYLISPLYSYLDTVSVIYKGQDITLVKILTAFTMIDLSNNQFHGTIPEAIGNLCSLRALNMSHNAFTGGIPSGFGGLAQLESLDLSWNQLSGEIPESLTSLTSLDYLNLSYNSLEGRIPQIYQFWTFTNSSFEGNVGLCGSPLSKQCNNDSSLVSPTQVSPSATAWKHRAEMILLFLFVGLGFGVGFALVVVFQAICRARRVWLNKLCIRR